jgi:uncharacterized DUF497 family protein
MAENEDTIRQLFARIRAFEWNESKREINWRDHQIDFRDARQVINGSTIIRRSDRKGEIRYMVFGFINGDEAVVVCTFRGDNCRVISARRARRDERKKYHSRLSRRSAEGQN